MFLRTLVFCIYCNSQESKIEKLNGIKWDLGVCGVRGWGQTPRCHFMECNFEHFWFLGDALYAEHQSSQEQNFYGPKVYFK